MGDAPTRPLGRRDIQDFMAPFGPWTLNFSRVRDGRLLIISNLCLNIPMNGNRRLMSRTAQPRGAIFAGAATSHPATAAGYPGASLASTHPMCQGAGALISNRLRMRFFVEKVSVYVRPHPGPLPQGSAVAGAMADKDGELSAVSTCDNGTSSFRWIVPGEIRRMTAPKAAEPFSFSWERRPG